MNDFYLPRDPEGIGRRLHGWRNKRTFAAWVEPVVQVRTYGALVSSSGSASASSLRSDISS
jgi:hypothetical protein